MFNYVDNSALKNDQGARAQRLFAAVVFDPLRRDRLGDGDISAGALGHRMNASVARFGGWNVSARESSAHT